MIQLGSIALTHRVVLLLILTAAAVLRFAGSTWGANHYLHPDERFITMVVTGIRWPATIGGYFDSTSSPLSPFNNGYTAYLYGTFPLFLAKLGGFITGDIVYGDAHLPGRWLSALADTGTVAMGYWVARRLFSPGAGLLAAILLAFAPLHIQQAHYFTVDSVASFLAIATFAAALRAADSRRWRWFVVAGMCAGLATASKPNLALTCGFLLLPALETARVLGIGSLLPPWGWRRDASSRERFPLLVATVVAFLAAFAAFRITQPYAFSGRHLWDLRLDHRWTDTLDYWRQVQSGHIDLPPGVQWADRTPMLFILDNLVRWGMGPALGILMLIALLAVGFRLALGRTWPSWWLLAIVLWGAFHLVAFGTGLVKAQRYLLPAYPFLIILAAGWLAGLRWSASPWWLRSVSPAKLRGLHAGLVALVVIGTVVSGLALTTIYLRPQTRVEASEWIYANVPEGSTIATEAWDDGLPLVLPGEPYPVDAYRMIQIAGYDPDTEAKLSKIVGQLHRSDYLVLSSDRLIGSIPRMPDRYPMMTAYYAALESGELGFEKVATFDSPPSLFGIELDDRGAEEALTVYDHPYVTIFRKTEAWSSHDARKLLKDALGDGGMQRRVIDPPESILMLDDADRREHAAGGTWSDMFDAADQPVLSALGWYLVLQLLALPWVPLLWRLLPHLPDRGYAIAKTIGIFGVAWAVWLLAALRIVSFGRPAIAIALLAACIAGGLVTWRHARCLVADCRRRWRWIAATESLFLTAFGAMLWLRTLNPDLWNGGRGGEKPMELAIFGAILRSHTFPPYDPWFAGGVLHYYYFGYLPWAVISRVTGIAPELAFNLALPSLFALLVVSVWSAAATLLVRLAPQPAGSARSWHPILLGLAAPFAVCILGSLTLVRMLGQGAWGGEPVSGLLARLGPGGELIWGIRNALVGSGTLAINAYWDPTRLIPNTINEFPYFSFLFADLHAHVLTMPVVATTSVIAVAVATVPVDTQRTGLFASLGGWSALTMAVVASFLLGVLLASNPWDYPAALALFAAAAAIRGVTRTGLVAPWRVVRDSATWVLLVLLVSRLMFQPFLNEYGSVTPQVLPGDETTLLRDYLTINGLPLLAIAAWLVIECRRSVGMLSRLTSQRVLVTVSTLACLGALYVWAVVSDSTSAFLLAALATTLVAAIGRLREPTHLLLLAMVALALGLALFAEHFRFFNDVGRMNLVFKLYLHAWQLLGIVAAVVSALIAIRIARAGFPSLGTRGELRPLAAAIAGRAWLVALAVLVIGAVSYPVLATPLRMDDRLATTGPTLDGFAYTSDATWAESPDGGEAVSFPLVSDREGVAWLRDHVEGSPVILEAQLPAYRWGGRVSSMTGLPTVLGWTWHEIQQRPGQAAEVDRRVADVSTIYDSKGSFASIQPLLDRYHVELIYVGPLERAIYDPEGLSKFDDAVESGELVAVYDANGVTIYALSGSAERLVAST